MIDQALTRSQFAELDDTTVARLIAAVEHDVTTWTTRLATAAAMGDAEGTRRARHALAGLCGNFGATALHRASLGPLADAQDRAALMAVCADTITAIRAIAG